MISIFVFFFQDRFYDMVDRVDRAIRNRRQSVNGNQKFDLDFEKLINLVKSMQSEGWWWAEIDRKYVVDELFGNKNLEIKKSPEDLSTFLSLSFL